MYRPFFSRAPPAHLVYCGSLCLTHKRALAICSISDSLVNGEEPDADERQKSFTDRMKLSPEIAVKAKALPAFRI